MTTTGARLSQPIRQTAPARSLVDAANWPDIARTPRAPLAAAVARALFRRAVRRLPVRVTFPDGTELGSGGADAPRMIVHRPEHLFARLGADLRIGFGESYMAGDWEPAPGTDLADLLTPFAARLTTLVPRPLQRLRGLVEDAAARARGQHGRRRALEHRAPLRPLQRALRVVPRSHDDVLGRVRSMRTKACSTAISRPRSCARSTGSSTTPA